MILFGEKENQGSCLVTLLDSQHNFTTYCFLMVVEHQSLNLLNQGTVHVLYICQDLLYLTVALAYISIHSVVMKI